MIAAALGVFDLVGVDPEIELADGADPGLGLRVVLRVIGTPVDGLAQLELGPFDFGGQVVTSLHFAVRYGEDEWESNDGTVVDIEPDTTTWTRIKLKAMSILPLESQL